MFVCVDCSLEYRVIAIGSVVESMTQTGPYQLLSCDVYECPGCQKRIARTANMALSEHFQREYAEYAAGYRGLGKLVCRSWHTAGEKQMYEAEHA